VTQVGSWDERRWHYRRSLASRVTLLTTIAVGLAVAFVALGAYVTVRMQMQTSMDSALLERAEAVAQTVNEVELRGADYKVPSWLLGASDVRLFLIRSDGTVFSADRKESLRFGQDEFDVARGGSDSAVRTIAQDGERYRAATWPTEREGGAVVLVQSLDPQDRVLGKLGLVMLLLGGAGVIAAGLAGWGVARNGLRPVRKLTQVAEEIARTEDLRPIAVEGNDEIARLASAFNQMLAALSASRDRQRQLVADAGHELRTPLTSLRTNLDLMLQADAAGGMAPESRQSCSTTYAPRSRS